MNGLLKLAHHRNARYTTRILLDAVLDLGILSGAYSSALIVRTIGTPLVLQQDALLFIVLSGLVTVTSLYFFGVYRRIWSRTSGHEIVVIFNATFVALVAVLFLNLILQPRPLPVSVILVAHALSFAGFAAVRFRSRLVSGLGWRWNAIWHRRFPKPETRVLIVGAGESGQALAWRLKYRSPGTAFRVIGYIDDDVEKHGMFVEGAKVLGGRTDLPQITKQQAIDLIVVAVHNIRGEDFREILNLCEKTTARIKVLPNLFAMMDETKNVQLLRDVQAEDLLGRSTITRHEAVDLSPVTGKVVLVTGAAGSIGSELARQLSSYDPVQIILIDNNESGLHDLHLELETLCPGTDYVPILADVTHYDVLAPVFQRYKPDVVFHAAAYKHVPLLQSFPGAAIRVNIEGTRCVAELARKHKAARFVLISSDKAVNPSNVMGATKRACELLLHMLAQKPDETLFTSVRFGNVLGSRGSVVPIFNRQIDLGGPVTVTDPAMTRYFMSIPEAVNLVIHAACLTHGDDIFFLKMGEVIRIVDLAERMIRLRGLRPQKDIEIKFTSRRPGEKTHEELFTADEAPQATVHPHIVLLNSWSERFDTPAFLDQLARVTQVGYFDCGSAMQALQSLMIANHEMVPAAD